MSSFAQFPTTKSTSEGNLVDFDPDQDGMPELRKIFTKIAPEVFCNSTHPALETLSSTDADHRSVPTSTAFSTSGHNL